MNKMFDKNGNHLSAKEICIIFGKDEILSVTAEEYAELERQIEIGKQEHEKVGELHNRLKQALEELEAIKSVDGGEAMEELQLLKRYGNDVKNAMSYYRNIENVILKAQAQERELRELKEKDNKIKDILALNYSYQEIGIKIERLFKEELK